MWISVMSWWWMSVFVDIDKYVVVVDVCLFAVMDWCVVLVVCF